MAESVARDMGICPTAGRTRSRALTTDGVRLRALSAGRNGLDRAGREEQGGERSRQPHFSARLMCGWALGGCPRRAAAADSIVVL